MRHPTTVQRNITFRHEYPWIWLKSTAETCSERTILDPESNVWNIEIFQGSNFDLSQRGCARAQKESSGQQVSLALCHMEPISNDWHSWGAYPGMCEFSHHIPCHTFRFASLRHRLGGQVVCTAGNGADSMKLGHRDGRWWKQCEDLWRELLSRHGTWVPVGWHFWSQLTAEQLRIIFLKGEADVYTKSGAGESDEPGVFHDRKVYEHTKNDLGVEESVDGKWWYFF